MGETVKTKEGRTKWKPEKGEGPTRILVPAVRDLHAHWIFWCPVCAERIGETEYHVWTEGKGDCQSLTWTGPAGEGEDERVPGVLVPADQVEKVRNVLKILRFTSPSKRRAKPCG